MKTTYRLLLQLYPRRHRDRFRDEMMQTLADQVADIERAGGRPGARFWVSTLGDTLRSIAREHALSLLEPGVARLALSALLMLPLYVVCYATLVTGLLALPHPPLNGFGALIGLTTLFLLPGVVSAAAGRALVGALRTR